MHEVLRRVTGAHPLALQQHLYTHAGSHKGLRARKGPLSLVACDRNLAILQGQMCSKHSSDVVGISTVRPNLLIIFSLFCLLIYATPSIAEAHPGRTASDGCHYCRTNCDKWGEAWGERHCHGGGGSYTAPVQETVQTQQAVPLPTNTPVPLRLPTKIPTRMPTNTPTPTPTVVVSPTATATPTIQPTKKAHPLKTSIKPQKPQGFFDWVLGVLGLR